MKISGVIILFLFIIIAGSFNAQAASVSLNMPLPDVYKDQTFDVKVTVDPQGASIAGVQLDVDFDSSTLQYISVKEGSLLKQNGANTYFTVTAPKSDSISNIIGVILGNSSVANPNVFATITFKAINGGTAFVELKKVKVSDPKGNLLNVSISSRTAFQVISSNAGSGSSSEGGGDGAGGASGENYANIELKEKYDLFIYKDITTPYCFREAGNPVVCVNITGNTNIGEITTVVEVLRNTSSLVKTPAEGIVYKNLNIWIGTYGFATPDNIKHAEITFKVPKSWIDANNIDLDSISMMRYDVNWQSLPTQKIYENVEEVYYETATSSFSPFTITGKKGDSLISSASSNIAPQEPEVKTTDGGETASSEPEGRSNWEMYLIVGAIAGIVLILLFFKTTKK